MKERKKRFDLENRIAIVTGSSQGIGKAIAQELVRSGAKVVVSDIQEESGKATTEELGDLADVDAGRMHGSYGLVRLIIWAIPVLGFLGTVIGMIAAFSELQQAGSEVDPTILAGGIWEALLTTAFGLSIAIPALGAFYLLEGRVENIRSVMKDAVVRINAALGQERRAKEQ